MANSKNNRLGWSAFAATALLVVGFASPGAALGDDADVLNARINTLNDQIGSLTAKAGALQTAFGDFGTSETAEDAPRILVAQSRNDVASLNVRVGQLEEQMRTLTGQIEGLQFQLTQLQTLLERMQEDNDARFTALEGGVMPGKTEAAPQSEGAMPSGGGPQPMDLSSDQGSDFDLDLDNLGDSPIELGSPERPLGTLSSSDLDSALDHSQDVGNLVNDGDADAQYQAGYDAFVRGEFEFAEEQFRQFIALFPEHPRAPDATNWLGETLIEGGQYDEAAEILLAGYQSYPSSSRAPDMLFKLGVALAGAGEYETACRTFSEVSRRYPDLQQSFRDRLQEQAGQAGC